MVVSDDMTTMTGSEIRARDTFGENLASIRFISLFNVGDKTTTH